MKNKMKKIISIVLCVVMVFGSAPLSGLVGLDLPDFNLFAPKAEAATYSGTCGTNMTWSLDTTTGELVISGTGNMNDFKVSSSTSNAPWFSKLSSIRTVKIESGVETIGDYAFYNCKYITNVEIPDSVTYIGVSAFNRCDGLTSIEIPDSVTNIGGSAFYQCFGLTNVIIPDSVTVILGYTFYFCKNLESVKIGDNVTFIDEYAFCECEKLKDITFGKSVKSIGSLAFSGCSSLKTLKLSNGITSIGNYAFSNCPQLTSIEIPLSVTEIKRYAFSDCKNLTNLYYEGTVEQWESVSFGEGTENLLSCNIIYTCNSGTCGENLTWQYNDGELVISGTGAMTSWTAASKVPWYHYFDSIKSVTIDSGVTKIGNNAFSGCVNLTNVNYDGCSKDWKKITIGSNNSYLSNATKHFTYYYIKWTIDGKVSEEKVRAGDSIAVPENLTKDYYVFDGWSSTIPAIMPESDLSFVAKYTPITYYADFLVDNNIIASIPYTVETVSIEEPEIPYKDGYTAIWETYELVPGGITVTAEYFLNTYTVSWIVDGEKNVDVYYLDEIIIKPADPEKEGYTFTGWDAEIPTTVPAEDLTFTATWEVNNYTVTWNVDGVITSETYDYGTEIIAPETPVKEGYTFKDWTISVPSTMPATNLDFVATWDINTYTITWNIGDTVETTDFDYGESVVSPEVNVEGYEFIKWIPDVPEIMPAENLEFTAMLASTAFDSGWGTEDNPYIISTTEQLDETRNHIGSSFKLANDIVFTESDFASGGAFYNGGRFWEPVFLYGTFDGDGHVIKGLKINARITASTEYPYIGLFGAVSGTIKNLGLVDGKIDVTITNADEAIIGAIVGFADEESVIENCFNTCDLNVTTTRTITVNYSNRSFADNYGIGGIVGMGYSEINNCFNDGDITVDTTVKITPNSNYYAEIDIIPLVGGITGGSSTVKNCYNKGDININSTATKGGTSSSTPRDYLTLSAVAGGISGMMSDVTNCYNEGNVNATLTDNYKSSNGQAFAFAGGLSAGATANNTISNCYNIGKVTASTISGAIVAYNEGTIINCYYLNNNDIGVAQGKDITVPCTPKEMVSESTYEGFDFNNSWVIIANNTPKLKNNIVSTESIEIDNAEISISNKETAQLTANLVPAYSTYSGVIWTSTNEDIATVDESGLVTAKKIGEATIKATSADGKAFAECKVTVNPADFTIIWIVDGVETVETVTETKVIVEHETPVKYGYTFSGWTPEVPDIMPDKNLVFSGSWTPVECELVFDATTGAFADGTTKITENVQFDSAINTPEAPSKAGYIFLGWALNNVNVGTDLGVMDDENGKYFTAIWVPSTDTRYAVETYTMNTEGEYVKTVQNFTGETDSTANAEYSVKTGFTLNNEKSILSGIIAADNSLVLKVYIDRNVYSFTTVVDGVANETKYFYESSIAEPAIPNKTGYTFVEWDAVIPATMPAKDVTITAEFDANSYDAVFNTNGGKFADGETSKTVVADFDSKIIAPANPVRQGYDFAGWDSEVGVMNDINGKTFNAKWTARNDTKYRVEIYTMGTDGKYSVSKENRTGTTDTIVSVTPSESTGFTFNSSKSNISGNIAADGSLVLTIYYDRNVYTFTTVINGKSNTVNYYYDGVISKPADPVKPGYKFAGWDKAIPSKMPANNVKVTANFELSFKMEIRNPSTTTISYGDSIVLHADMNEALPSGWKIKWTSDNGNFGISASSDGSTCTITPNKSGDTIFTVTVYDENGNEICKDTQTMKSKAGFFDKFIAFFKKLFGATKVIPQAFKVVF